MFKKSLHIIIFTLLCMTSFSACQDDLLYDDSYIPDGHAVLTATIDFNPMIETANDPLGRAHKGDTIRHIKSLSVFVYDAEGNLYNIYNQANFTDFKIYEKDKTYDKTEPGPNTGMPNDVGGKPVQSEATSARATFTIKDIPFGRYSIYAVANLGNFENDEATRKRFATAKDLQAIQVEWNATDMGKNDAMFGYFTLAGNDTETSDGFTAPLVPISQKFTQLHAWIKRTTSKVTVVFDGSGLHEDIWIYIKSVTIKDIPRYCKLGEENDVHTTSADSMIAVGDCIYYNQYGELESGKTPADNYEDWLMISKGTRKKGSVTVNDRDSVIATHSEYDNALFFFENCQGDFEGQKKYNKKQLWDEVGFVSNKPGDYDYKDNVPYGTYIEVEAYYVSQNVNQVTNGPIKYRYMLGQNDTYNYDAIRNHHYKLTLGFRGYANQPDWHIEYIEPPLTYYVDPTYYVSYSYNSKAIFPIRFKGDVESFEVEIVENNWGPYDATGDLQAPDAVIGTGPLAFYWNRTVYENIGGGMFYGLQKPYSTDGKNQIEYSKEEIAKGAPSRVTPIWAGFLALNVPDGRLEPVIIPGTGTTYNSEKQKMKDYFYGTGGGNTKVKQNIRKFTKEDLAFPGWTGGKVMSKVVGQGNNTCEIIKAADGSITLRLPTWTRPKSILGISGFTGNNPYEAFKRKATLKLSAKFVGSDKVMTKYMPVYQVERMLNPKAIWRQWDDNENFKVKLMYREKPDTAKFKSLTSSGAWRAYIKNTSEDADGFISLSGGIGPDSEHPGGIIGNPNTEVSFDIIFNGKGKQNRSFCAIVAIEYHGFTCNHNLFVRQGYYEPISITNSTRWSSFNLFKCNVATHSSDPYIGWNDPANPTVDDYISAEVTATPVSMSTLFKRGNYAEGILISNNYNTALGPLVAPGSTPLVLTNNPVGLPWSSIDGYAYTTGSGNGKPGFGTSPRDTWKWGRFKVMVKDEMRFYRVPSYEDYKSLQDDGEYGIGVLYADGATTPSEDVNMAYGFVDTNNDGSDDYHGIPGKRGGPTGMRGFIVFNPSNAHQIFFPLGANGIGRRTIQNASGSMSGVLRYGAVASRLTQEQNTINQYRPIPFNLPASPGAVYWIETRGGAENQRFIGWDMNFFDLNFQGYDYACGFWPTGDALPIKLVIDEDGPWPNK